jgi:DNA-binding transcriptional ArsR family regulator
MKLHYAFFNNLANPLRIKIIYSLKNDEKNVGQIVKEIKEEQSKVSHALSSLKKCNLVTMRKAGKIRLYALNKKTLHPLFKIIEDHTIEGCGNNCKQCNICKVEFK